MPGEDRVIDPMTRDYVDDGQGSWEKTTTVATALYLQLTSELNAWAGDPEAGSELHLIAKDGKGDRVGLKKAEDFVRRAFRSFLDEGRIADLKVSVDTNQLGRLVLVMSCRDVQQGTGVEIGLPLPYGA